MLHMINISSEAELNWIIQLQRDILTAICTPEVDGQIVTIDWLKELRQDIEENWFERFCNRKDNLSGIKQPLIEHLKVIADSDAQEKTKIIENFNSNHGFREAFEPDTPNQRPGRNYQIESSQPK